MNEKDMDYFGDDKMKAREPIYFVKEGEEYRVNPIYSLDDGINTPRRFVILKTTAGGKYMKGGMLWYRYKKTEIYTDEKNAIFVDTVADRIYVRDYSRVLNEIAPIDPEERQYIFLLYDENSYDYQMWDSVVGRSNAYQYVKDHIELMDPKISVVLTDNVAFKDALTVYQFVNHLKNSELVEDDEFNIDDWIHEEE